MIGILGCSQSKLVTFNSESPCVSTVEGFYHTGESWDDETPALICHEGQSYVVRYGKVLAMDEQTVLFDEKKGAYMIDPKPENFSLKEVYTIIDEEGNIIHGHLPAKYSKSWRIEMHICRIDDPNQKIKKMTLFPESSFSYCLESGTYKVEQMLFIDPKSNIDRYSDSQEFVFNVENNAVNYIGDIYLDLSGNEGSTYDLPYMIHSRPQAAAVAGVMGGAIGGAILAAAQASKGVIGTHKLRIVENDSFNAKAPMPVKVHLFQQKSETWGM